MHPARLRRANAAPERPQRRFVLYWMTAARRLHDNHALDHALARAQAMGRPLLVLEALRIDWPWASGRTHRFVAEGMRANAAEAHARRIGYHPWLEPEPGAAKGLLAALAADACLVVADEFPCTFVPRMLAAAAARIDVAMDVVDGTGLLPLAAGRAFDRAVDLRRFLQRNLGPHLRDQPAADPRSRLPPAEVPAAVARRWPASALDAVLAPGGLDRFALHPGGGAGWASGGAPAAQRQLAGFLDQRLHDYAEQRRHPDRGAGSELSAWLHWGHISAHRVVRAVLERGGWDPSAFGAVTNGSKDGWWGVDADREGFLDELVTWRELGHLFGHHRPGDEARYEALPAWALRTLATHAGDPRPHRYALDELERAATHDPLWNAAQTQLVREGRMHNYLRMLWGKKILEWSADARAALAAMIDLNNRYALDGTDPNSYTGIMWVLGRFDRPWAPERPIYGSVRCMTTDSTLRKLRCREYLVRYAPAVPAAAQTSFL